MFIRNVNCTNGAPPLTTGLLQGRVGRLAGRLAHSGCASARATRALIDRSTAVYRFSHAQTEVEVPAEQSLAPMARSRWSARWSSPALRRQRYLSSVNLRGPSLTIARLRWDCTAKLASLVFASFHPRPFALFLRCSPAPRTSLPMRFVGERNQQQVFLPTFPWSRPGVRTSPATSRPLVSRRPRPLPLETSRGRWCSAWSTQARTPSPCSYGTCTPTTSPWAAFPARRLTPWLG